MTSIVDSHPYLFSALFNLPVVLVAAWLAPLQRKMMVLCAVTFAAFSPLSIIHEGTYWRPERIVPGGWGVEDVLFCMFVGSLTWVMAAWPLRDRLVFEFKPLMFLKRLAPFGLGSLASLLAIQYFFFNSMISTIVVQTALTVGFMIYMNRLWALAARASFMFMIYYTILVFIAGFVFTDFYNMWSGPEVLGFYILNYPIEEYLWALSLGFLPLCMIYATDARIVSPSAERTTKIGSP